MGGMSTRVWQAADERLEPLIPTRLLDEEGFRLQLWDSLSQAQGPILLQCRSMDPAARRIDSWINE